MPGYDVEAPKAGVWSLIKKTLLHFTIGVIKTGKVPKHVAFEMDGNRRYARQNNLAIREGHAQGCNSLYRLLDSTYKCGVRVVTIYAFSIENFNRADAEVEDLMELSIYMMDKFSAPGEVLDRNGVCLRILGQRELIRSDVLAAADSAVEGTRHNNKLRSNLYLPGESRPANKLTWASSRSFLNVCLAYTSRFEITAAVCSAIRSRLDSSPTTTTDEIARDDKAIIHMVSLEQHMLTADNPPLDLLIRSSGVERLSDFLLWQAHQDTQLFFVKTLWPAFSFFSFARILFEWQWRQAQ